jgi:hypothetical protein
MKTSLLFGSIVSAAVGQVEKSTACLECTSTCALIPPTSSFPCYQGAPQDANFCYNSDPLLATGTTYACGVCSSYGFPTYLQNDPIYKNMELWGSGASEMKVDIRSDACLECGSTCALLPPADSSLPCYQGTSEDANFCFNTDILLPKDGTHACGVCSDFGYSSYLRNDPVYRNMELWGTQSLKQSLVGKVEKSTACLECTSTCALIPPTSSFPCYQGAPQDANFCYNSDPLLATGTTYACGVCSSYGFPTYLQNDPIYKNMELWGSGATVNATH